MSTSGPFPYLDTTPVLDAAVQAGKGVAAAVLGQPFNVQRLNDETNVSITANAPIFTNYPMLHPEREGKPFVENRIMEILAYAFTVDNTYLQIGDLCTATGYKAMPSDVYTVAQIRPMRKTILVRTESTVTISRIMPDAGAAAQQPAFGTVFTAGYSGAYKEAEEVLTLVNGLYAFTSNENATPAQIMVGMSPNARVRDGNTLGVPTEQYRDQFMIYIPLLPGEMLNELDRINFGQSDRYEIAKFFSTDETGLAGQICIVEKLGGS